ncbi:MAG: hypothetical protein LBQ77_01725 [Treponema sp.]|nr:hypothetical protein [Treponema sp.]
MGTDLFEKTNSINGQTLLTEADLFERDKLYQRRQASLKDRLCQRGQTSDVDKLYQRRQIL